MWFLGIEPGAFGRTVSALTISPAPQFPFLIWMICVRVWCQDPLSLSCLLKLGEVVLAGCQSIWASCCHHQEPLCPTGIGRDSPEEQGLARDSRHAWSSCATSLATSRTKEKVRVPVPPAAATSLPHGPSVHSCPPATNYQECGGLPGLNQDQLSPSGQAPQPD